jgi:hypothetical protein
MPNRTQPDTNDLCCSKRRIVASDGDRGLRTPDIGFG